MGLILGSSASVQFATIPDITFVAGTASTVDLNQYLTDPSSQARATELLKTTRLPDGVTFNPFTMVIDYNGYTPAADQSSTVTARTHYYSETDEQLWTNDRNAITEIYSYDLNGDTTDTALRNEALASLNSTQLTRSSTQFITGGASMRFELNDADGSTGSSFARAVDGDTGGTPSRFYTRWCMFHPRDTLAYRYAMGVSTGQLKLLNIGQFGGGQIVVAMLNFTGAVTAFVNGSSNLVMVPSTGLEGTTTDTPFNAVSGSQGQLQNAIDTVGGTHYTGSDGSTINQWLERYGHFHDAHFDYLDVGFDAGTPYLDERQPQHGWPDNRCDMSAVAIQPDGWMVYEAFVDIHQTIPGNSSFQLWAAPYGMPPQLALNWVGNLPLTSSGNNEWRLEWSDFDTERTAQVGVRPTLFTYVDQILNSEGPIPFPGGHALPSNQG